MANVRKSSRSINKLPYSALSPFIVIYRVYSEVFVTLTTALFLRDGAQGRNRQASIHAGFRDFGDYTLLLTLLKADSIPPFTHLQGQCYI